jgi:hypothetical protein
LQSRDGALVASPIPQLETAGPADRIDGAQLKELKRYIDSFIAARLSVTVKLATACAAFAYVYVARLFDAIKSRSRLRNQRVLEVLTFFAVPLVGLAMPLLLLLALRRPNELMSRVAMIRREVENTRETLVSAVVVLDRLLQDSRGPVKREPVLVAADRGGSIFLRALMLVGVLPVATVRTISTLDDAIAMLASLSRSHWRGIIIVPRSVYCRFHQAGWKQVDRAVVVV